MEQDAVNNLAEPRSESEVVESSATPETAQVEEPSVRADTEHEASSSSKRAGADRLFGEIAQIRDTLNYLGSALEVQGIKLDHIIAQPQGASGEVSLNSENSFSVVGDSGSRFLEKLDSESFANLSSEDAESIAECVRIRLEGEFSSILYDVGRIADLIRNLSSIGDVATTANEATDEEPISLEQPSIENLDNPTIVEEKLEKIEKSISVIAQQIELQQGQQSAEGRSLTLENLAVLEDRIITELRASLQGVKSQLQGLSVSADAKSRGAEVSAFAFKEMELALAAKIDLLAEQLTEKSLDDELPQEAAEANPFEEQFAMLWRALDAKLDSSRSRLRLYDNIFYGLVVLLLLANLTLMGWQFFIR